MRMAYLMATLAAEWLTPILLQLRRTQKTRKAAKIEALERFVRQAPFLASGRVGGCMSAFLACLRWKASLLIPGCERPLIFIDDLGHKLRHARRKLRG